MNDQRLLTVAIPVGVHSRLKAFAGNCGYTLSEVVTAVLDEALEDFWTEHPDSPSDPDDR